MKGALVGIDLFNPVASVVTFQYNPASVTRTVKPRGPGGGDGDRAEAQRLTGPPEEDITMDVEIDATDALEKGDDDIVQAAGIYPQLSALEMLAYPKSLLVSANTVLLAVGTIEVLPPTGPFTFLIWGAKRVLPVRIGEIAIGEEAYDAKLNPIRAKVTLTLKVLTYNDLSITHPGYYVFLAHHVVKETMATIATVNDIAAVAGGDVKLI
jgi:hypothetical protein